MKTRTCFECFYALSLMFLFGCGTVTEYTFDPATGKATKKVYANERQSWEATVDRRIDEETKGDKPLAGAQTWENYWRDWYKTLRQYPDGEERVAWIKARRTTRGLPTYD
jgi:hypothetical protein